MILLFMLFSMTKIIRTDHILIGITIPKAVYNEVEKRRGDISRSRFLMRIIEEKMGLNVKCQ